LVLKKLLRIFAFSIFLLTSLTSLQNAYGGLPTNMSPTSGVVGDTFTLSGNSGTPNELFHIIFGDDLLFVGNTNPDGSFLVNVQVPVNLPGDYPVTFLGIPSGTNISFGDYTVLNGSVVGGEMIPIDITMVLLAGTPSVAAWMIPVIVSAIGIGIVIADNKGNSFKMIEPIMNQISNPK